LLVVLLAVVSAKPGYLGLGYGGHGGYYGYPNYIHHRYPYFGYGAGYGYGHGFGYGYGKWGKLQS
jgi:hypothetical protein